MKRKFKEIGQYKTLYRDDKTGIAWIEDGTTGTEISVHANIDTSGSVRGMKNLGYWKRKDRTVRSHGFVYNVDIFVCNTPYEKIVAAACRCVGCRKRLGI